MVGMVAIFLFTFLAGYLWVIFGRWWTWQNMPVQEIPANYIPETLVSVIIPARNEAENIGYLLQDVAAQQYPKALLEIIVVDDNSEDTTGEIVNTFASAAGLNIKYIRLKKYTTAVGKKAAIKEGIAQATGALLVFTDGDCRVPPGWLVSFENIYCSKNAKFISGPVCFQNTHSVFEKMQLVEFVGLIGVGAASIALGKPNMCNGANIAYPKYIFQELNGFAGNEHIPSGDDEFMLHKIHAAYPQNIYFLKNPDATVYTNAKKSLQDFFTQRTRWASKWPAYQNISVKFLAFLVFGANAFLFITLLLGVAGEFPLRLVFLGFALKFLADILVIYPMLQFFKKTEYAVYILLWQFIYIPYVLVTALAGIRRKYTWKGRVVKS